MNQLYQEVLFPGEKEICSLNGVLHFRPLTGCKKGQLCNLICTNLRILFIPYETSVTSTTSINKVPSANFQNHLPTPQNFNSNDMYKQNYELDSKFICKDNEKFYKLDLYTFFWLKIDNKIKSYIFHSNVDYILYYRKYRKGPLNRSAPKKLYPCIYSIQKNKQTIVLRDDGMVLQIFCKNLCVESFLIKFNDSVALIGNDGLCIDDDTKLPNVYNPDSFVNMLLKCVTQSKSRLFKNIAKQSLINVAPGKVLSTRESLSLNTSKDLAKLHFHKHGSSGPKYSLNKDVRYYFESKDWLGELERVGVKGGWRVTLVNECFHLSPSLPKSFLVPASQVDSYLKSQAYYFVNDAGRIPFWCWASRYGCTLIRSSAAIMGKRGAANKNRNLTGRRLLSFGTHHDPQNSANQGRAEHNAPSSSPLKQQPGNQSSGGGAEEIEYVLVETLRQLHPNRKTPIRVDIDRELFGDHRSNDLVRKGTEAVGRPLIAQSGSLNSLYDGERAHDYPPGLMRVYQSFRALKKLVREKMNHFEGWLGDEKSSSGFSNIKLHDKRKMGARCSLPTPSPSCLPKAPTLETNSVVEAFGERNGDSSSYSFASHQLLSNDIPLPLTLSAGSVKLLNVNHSQSIYTLKSFTNDSVRSTKSSNFDANIMVSPTNSRIAQSYFSGHGTSAAKHKHWLSVYESTGWGQLVRSCIQTASTVAYHMMVDQFSVVLVERKSTLFSPLISSLAILLMDPHARTLSGFNSLIQKEWVVMGHPFGSLYGNTETNNPDTGLTLSYEAKSKKKPKHAPIFHLFLECIWQVSLQYPSSFAFSEQYLIHLSDCCYSPLYDTFSFNNMHERCKFYSDLSNDSDKSGTLDENNISFTATHQASNYKNEILTHPPKTITINEMPRNDQTFLYVLNSVWNRGEEKMVGNKGKDLDGNSPIAFRNPWYYFIKTFTLAPDLACNANSASHRSKPNPYPNTNSDLLHASSLNHHYLIPKISQPLIAFWSNYYLRWWHRADNSTQLAGLNGNDLLAYRTHTVLCKLSALSLERDKLEKRLRRKSAYSSHEDHMGHYHMADYGRY